MIKCPFCNEDIEDNETTCPHCHTSLEKKCPYCGETISYFAVKCKHCNSWLNKFSKLAYEEKTGQKNESSAQTALEIEEAIENKKKQKRISLVMSIETIVAALLFEEMYGWEVWQTFLCMIVIFAATAFRPLRILYIFGISILWGYIIFLLAPWLNDGVDIEYSVFLALDNPGEYWVEGLIAFILSIGLHIPAMSSDYEE